MVSSGPISLGGSATSGGLNQSVAVELGLSPTAQISLNDTAVRNLAGIPSGKISLHDLYGKTKFVPLVRSYNSPVTSVIETAPLGATTVVIEVWGGGGGGGSGSGTGMGISSGGDGGAGGYSRSSYTILSSGTQTFTYTVGNYGAGQVAAGPIGNGSGSSVTSALSGFTTMNATGGSGGQRNGNGGAGGIGSGGNAANLTGASGSFLGGTGTPPPSGVYYNTPPTTASSSGAGGLSGNGNGNSGDRGFAGAVVFRYS